MRAIITAVFKVLCNIFNNYDSLHHQSLEISLHSLGKLQKGFFNGRTTKSGGGLMVELIRNNIFFEARKKFPKKNVATKLEGGG